MTSLLDFRFELRRALRRYTFWYELFVYTIPVPLFVLFFLITSPLTRDQVIAFLAGASLASLLAFIAAVLVRSRLASHVTAVCAAQKYVECHGAILALTRKDMISNLGRWFFGIITALLVSNPWYQWKLINYLAATIGFIGIVPIAVSVGFLILESELAVVLGLPAFLGDTKSERDSRFSTRMRIIFINLAVVFVPLVFLGRILHSAVFVGNEIPYPEYTLTSLAILCVGTSLTGSYVLNARMRQQMRILSEFTSRLAEGDLRKTHAVTSPDEPGIMANEANRALFRLREALSTIRKSQSELGETAVSIDNSVHTLNTVSQSLAKSAELTSASLKELSAALTSKIARTTEELTTRGKDAVHRAVIAMREIIKRISIVEEIADQTHLLSLNASIEAARSGEHGRSFAVVAAEIGKLADLSSIAAAEIRQLTDQSLSVADEAESSLAEVTPKVSETSDLVLAMQGALATQDQMVKTLVQEVQQIDTAARQAAAAATDLEHSASAMQQQSSTLKEKFSFFKTGKWSVS